MKFEYLHLGGARALLLATSTRSLGEPGKLHPDPTSPCHGGAFKPHEICFELPEDGIARDKVRSESFCR